MPAFLINRHQSLKLLPHCSGETKELVSSRVFYAHWHLVRFASYNKPLLGTRRIPEKLEPAAGNTVGLLSGPSQPPQTECEPAGSRLAQGCQWAMLLNQLFL